MLNNAFDSLYILGNGFDLAHRMPTGYRDFRRWLVENNRFDVIQELQSAYPAKIEDDYLLWSQFEKALGEYDLDTVINWSWENLYLTEDSLGNQLFNSSFIDTQLPDIIDEAFSKWVRSIKIAAKRAYEEIPLDALYLTFNYTDTLEQLYHIPERQVLYIHGRASKGDKLIFGHNHEIYPADYWDDSIDMRENNERMQRLTDMNTLCKPVYEIIERNEGFFKRLESTKDIHIIGHSCEAVDYPYFRKVIESTARDAKWYFYPFADEDKKRVKKLINEIAITNYQINVTCPPPSLTTNTSPTGMTVL